MPPSMTPSRVPKRDQSGFTLRTFFSSFAIALSSKASDSPREACPATAPLPIACERRFGRHHARQHGVVDALDARHVHEARAAADQRAAGEGKLRDSLPAAFGQRAGAIGDALAAFEMRRR